MRKIRISNRHRPAKWWLEPLPLDLRDRDIMRAKRLTRPLPPGQRRGGRPAEHALRHPERGPESVRAGKTVDQLGNG